MASAKQDEGQKKEGAEQLYIPPTAVPSESEYRTLDNLSVRLADDIDPRLAKTEVPRRRSQRESARLGPVRFVAFGALVLGAALAWALSGEVTFGPSVSEEDNPVVDQPAAAPLKPSTAVEWTALQPTASELGSSEPQVAPAPAQLPEMLPKSASSVGTVQRSTSGAAVPAAAPSDVRGANRVPRTAPKPSHLARRRNENDKAASGGSPSPVEASSSGNKVWVKPPGRKVWMK